VPIFMNRRIFTLALSLLALPVAAHAQTTTGTYVSFGAGFNKMPQEDVDVQIVGVPGSDVKGEVLTSIGPALAGAVGRAFHNGWRVEVEGNYLSNAITGESGLSGEDLGTGTERKSGLMGNAVYEFPGTHVRPYVGGGLGAQFVHEPDAVSSSDGVTVAVTGGTKTSFAYQLIAGAAFPVHAGGRLSITTEYRFLALTGTRVYNGTATVPGVGSFDLIDTSDNDMNHSVMFGIRYTFGG
jgi:opacity protein-like surface antigen